MLVKFIFERAVVVAFENDNQSRNTETVNKCNKNLRNKEGVRCNAMQ